MFVHLDTVFYLFIALVVIMLSSRKQRPLRGFARRMRNRMKKAHPPRHEWQLVDAEDFSDLDLDFYERGRCELEADEFTYLGDIECLTVKKVLPCKTFIRVMLGRDGTVSAGLYHPKFKFWMRIPLWVFRLRIDRIVDLETEFSDGCFVCTSNAEMGAKMSKPPQVHARYLKTGAPIREVLEAHDRGIREYLDQNPDVEILVFHSLEEVMESQNRQNAIRAAFRESVGWVTKGDLERIAGEDKTVAHALYEEIEQMQEEESGPRSGRTAVE